jgi:hypothetical protein
MDHTVPPHWLRVNADSRSPHRVLFLDTETSPTLTDRAEEHRLRWWHARLCRRHVARPRSPLTVDYAGDTIGELAAIVADAAIARHTLWVYTHNLNFDLTATMLPELLHGHGFELVDLGITGRSPWLRLANGRRRIVFADSASWMPEPLAEVGKGVGVLKPDIDDWATATDEEIAHRCLADTVILAEAMLEIMDWWDDNDMGRWQWTGPGCGWAAFRHAFLHSKVLMDPDPARLEIERRAIYGGRREAFRIGDLGPARFADLDFAAAYPRIASTAPLPRRAIADVPALTLERYRQLPADWGVLADVTVTTRRPLVPCRVGRSVLYPVGTFQTTLAGPDIDALLAGGAGVRFGRTIIYQLEPFLAEWGQWVCGVIDGTGPDVPAPVRTMVKHWSRTVIGRWAMRAQRTEDWGEACWPSWHAEQGTDLDTGCEVIDLHACGRHLRLTRDAEPENVFPAVTAWVEARCRQALASAMAEVDGGEVVQCDTDGFLIMWQDDAVTAAAGELVDPSGDGSMGGLAAPRPPVPELVDGLPVRVKGLYRNATVLGPQQVIKDAKRKISGVPRGFEPKGPLTWHGWTWPGYAWQLAHSRPGVYTRPHVTVALRGPYGCRWVLKTGRTVPPLVRIRRGVNELVRPGPRAVEVGYLPLAESQPALLDQVAV